MSTFQNLVIRGQSYDSCSACSPKILDAYRKAGWGFVRKALQEKDYVAELSGLAEVQRRAEEMAAQVDWEEGGRSRGGGRRGVDLNGACKTCKFGLDMPMLAIDIYGRQNREELFGVAWSRRSGSRGLHDSISYG